MGITKTDFMRGMQCRKMLWLDKHKPDLKVIPPEIQKRLDAGNDFGDRAMAMFGEFEEMTVYRSGTTIPDIERVRAALKALTPEERDIIMNFYFSENPLSGEALAKKFATTKSSIYRRRDHALRKLKSILGNA